MKKLSHKISTTILIFCAVGLSSLLTVQAASIENSGEVPETVKDLLMSQEVGILAPVPSLENIPSQEVPTAGGIGDSSPESHASSQEYSDLAIADVNDYVNVRSTPDTNGEILGKMYDGSVAHILSAVGEGEDTWFQVTSGSVEGYIKAEYFIYGEAAAAVIEDYVTRFAQVEADRLNVRKEADINSSRIGYLDHGEKAKILELGEEWHKVQYADGSEGFVSSQYVTVLEEFNYAKSIEEERAEQEARRKAEAEAAARAAKSEQAAPESTNVTPPSTSYTSNEELRSAIVEYAKQFVGNKYVSGGRSLTSGTDCSGFTCYVFADFGYSISRTPQGQWTSNGRSISVDEIQPGDVVCYSSNGSKCTHVGLYIGDGKIVHAANSRRGVVTDDIYYDDTFLGVKNIID